MQYSIRQLSLALVAGTGLLLGGCATKDDVQTAQKTADAARAQADAAVSAAQAAQSASQAAAQKADLAAAEAKSANDKIDQMTNEERHESKAERKHHPRRHLHKRKVRTHAM